MTDYAPPANGVNIPPELSRMYGKTIPSGEGCLVWQGATTSEGYPRHQVPGLKATLAHRIAYELAYGAIPDELTVDHICFTPACINAEHLRLLTLSENAKNQRSALRTHCVNGHEFTEENTYIRTAKREGRRQCRQCNRDAVKRYQERKRSLGGVA